MAENRRFLLNLNYCWRRWRRALPVAAVDALGRALAEARGTRE